MPQLVKALKGCVRCLAPVYEQDASLGREAYRLHVGDNGVVIAISSKAGAFYAEKTLAQLRQADGSYPAVEIEDWPAYPWCGFLLDEGRHFFGKETVKRVLDLMAYHKLNVFHWHLTEDQGWRSDVSEGGWISLELARAEKGIVLEVADSGCGISRCEQVVMHERC